jgi:hypothetical protein
MQLRLLENAGRRGAGGSSGTGSVSDTVSRKQVAASETEHMLLRAVVLRLNNTTETPQS